MRVGVLGTGVVGQTLASKLVELEHEVRMGARTKDNPRAGQWLSGVGSNASAGDFAEAAEFGELVVNATAGEASLAALGQAGADNLAGKVLMDVANPLDFSHGMPPRLAYANDTSLAEEIQHAFPGARVVKALNTVNAGVMVAPAELGESTAVFICGDDDGAKRTVSELLESFGWLASDIVDLGDVSAARGPEMYLPLWLRIMGVYGPKFNVRIVAGE